MPGAILQPQPPPWDREVRRGVGAQEVVVIAVMAEGSRSRTYQEAPGAPSWV